MRIRTIRIRNFRSLKDVALEDLGPLAILIGENGAGKTALLEALELFFSGFTASLSSTLEGTTDWLWFDRDLHTPISFELEIELSDNDADRIFPESTDKSGRPASSLTIRRTLTSGKSGKTATWQTVDVIAGSTHLVKAGVIAAKERPKPKVDPQPSTLPSPGESTPETEPSPTPTDDVLQELAAIFNEGFKLVRSARHKVPPTEATNERDTLLPDVTIARITELLNSEERADMKAAAELGQWFRLAAPGGIQAYQTGLQVQEGDIRFPLRLIGGGTQELLGLLLETVEAPDIFALEEPEIHLHTRYQRILLSILRTVSEQRQVLIATHSETFVNETEPDNVWFVRKVGKATEIHRGGQTDELRRLLQEAGFETVGDFFRDVGSKPSTVYLQPSLLLVNDLNMKVILPLFARKLGIDFDAAGIAIESLTGIGSEAYHLGVWTRLAESSRTNVALLITPRAAAARRELARNAPQLVPDDRVLTLEHDSLLDFIPAAHLATALRAAPFRLTTTKEETSDLTPPVHDKVAQLLYEKNKNVQGWQYLLAKRALQEADSSDIPTSLRIVLERAHRLLTAPSPA